jgi:hypothetical protein
MADAEDRIDPKPQWPSVPRIFASAKDAFDAGNYPLALHLAADDTELAACAKVMCGAILPGLMELTDYDSPRARLVRAYGHWCLDHLDEARGLLETLTESEFAVAAARLRGYLDEPPAIAIVTMPGSTHAASYVPLAGFDCRPVQIEPRDFGITLTEALKRLDPGFRPKLVVALDAYGPWMPREPEALGAPLAIWAGDHDYFYTTRFADYARADVIVANSAAEQIELAAHYSARVAAMPGHEGHLESFRFSDTTAARDVDVLFSGRAFTPYMRDKAQFLFRLATLDDPELRVELIDGYLGVDAYAAALGRAKTVPLWWRYAGGMQTRGIEALLAGAAVLSPEAGIAAPLLGPARANYKLAVDAPPLDLAQNPAAVERDGLTALFWNSPRREERFLKFCLFQTLWPRARSERAAEPSYIPAEMRGYDPARGTAVYTAVARLNARAAEPDAASFTHAAAAAFYASLLVADNPTVAQRALDFYYAGINAFPEALALRFNGARACWTFGQRRPALEHFQTIVDNHPGMTFEPATDALLSHRIRPLADMFPYGDYFRAVVARRKRQASDMIVSAALTYIAADLIERAEAALAVSLLRRAVERTPVHVAGWRLLARALALSGGAPQEIRQAFYHAVNLYPPEIFDLLPIGLAAELAERRRSAAADILRRWTLARVRVHAPDGRPAPASNEAIQSAYAHRALLGGWIRALLDPMVGA